MKLDSITLLRVSSSVQAYIRILDCEYLQAETCSYCVAFYLIQLAGNALLVYSVYTIFVAAFPPAFPSKPLVQCTLLPLLLEIGWVQAWLENSVWTVTS